MAKLVITGDSNTAAIYVSTANSYAQKIGEALGFTNIVNTAISGKSSTSLLSDLTNMVLSHNPDECIIMIGTNDLAYSSENGIDPKITTDTYISNMNTIINTLLTNNIKVTILSPPMSRNSVDWAAGQQMTDALKDLCFKKHVNFIDVYGMFSYMSKSSVLSTFNSYFRDSPDLYHLTDAGHQLITDFILSQRLGYSVYNTTNTDIVLTSVMNASFGNINGCTVRTVINALEMTNIPILNISKVRLTLKASTDENLVINNMYIGQTITGCTALNLHQVKVTGASAFTINTNSELITDWIPFSWNKTSPIVLSFYSNGGNNSDKVPANYNNANAISWLKTGNDSATLAPIGFTQYAGYLSLITKLEMDGF